MKLATFALILITILALLQTDVLPWRLVSTAELKKTQTEVAGLRQQLEQRQQHQQQQQAATQQSNGTWMRDQKRRGALDREAYNSQSARYQGF